MNVQKKTADLVLAALFLAIGLVLPFLTGQIPQIGKMLSPMHIPVYLCGMILGKKYGLAVGFILPPLRAVLFGMPALFPQAVGMAFELATYGFVAGFLYARFKEKNWKAVYVSLIAAMLCGRVVWGLANIVLYGIQGNRFTVALFLAGAFVNAVPGIILHLLLVPAVMAVVGKLRTPVSPDSSRA